MQAVFKKKKTNPRPIMPHINHKINATSLRFRPQTWKRATTGNRLVCCTLHTSEEALNRDVRRRSQARSVLIDTCRQATAQPWLAFRAATLRYSGRANRRDRRAARAAVSRDRQSSPGRTIAADNRMASRPALRRRSPKLRESPERMSSVQCRAVGPSVRCSQRRTIWRSIRNGNVGRAKKKSIGQNLAGQSLWFAPTWAAVLICTIYKAAGRQIKLPKQVFQCVYQQPNCKLSTLYSHLFTAMQHNL